MLSNVTVNVYICSHLFVSLMIARCEPKNVGDVVQNSKVHITRLSDCRWIVTNSDKIHQRCKILIALCIVYLRTTDLNYRVITVHKYVFCFNRLKYSGKTMYHIF